MWMVYLNLPYVTGASSICAEGPRAISALERLSIIFGLEGLSDSPQFRVCANIVDSLDASPLFTEDNCLDFHLVGNGTAVIAIHGDADIDKPFFAAACGRLLLTAVQSLNPSERIALHGALLEEDHCGIALLAGSGVGKSTTMKRHNAVCGEGIADDWFLLHDTPSGVAAQVLPTWSRVAHDGHAVFPLKHVVPLKGIGILKRADGTRPRMENIDSLEFYRQAFNSSETLTGLVLRRLPTEYGVAARRHHVGMIDKLLCDFTPFQYFASLDDSPSNILFH